ncbi:fumarylacetoacetate hydrolase family protein [Novosphingobium mathurense]|uniref:2-keto-4-pentenoate hydratase/2-oxohepta-3-ene-1,7-dioic acid hydratase (Catechol pathway) n=1 Tax=Novosphingobium mathurense TaxID=428990 RepID=A0A1U6IJF0_9SPHN|nr:fumarylacetoacetate hydrolase family protein [Novosphingobium mathurense]SLK08165.1 2-keto-4-pentenoate hydratase/2-oxohepta-3-ene-1,7-dioic acid hydratase (catechol pathway) [Novosphingobium mathurense]
MKLVRFDKAGTVGLGVLDNGSIIPLTALKERYPTMLSVIEGGDAALDEVRAVAARSEARIALDSVKLLAPIERPGKYLAIGMNYRKHVEEAIRAGVAEPTHQYWFNKQTTCISGPFDDIDPGVTEKLDWEVELAVVIGRKAKSVSEAEAPDYVFGYTVANDVSARDWQKHSPTFTVGKSFDTHGPIGPCIVTADEIGDPHRLGLRCIVNGVTRQEGNTSELIHSVWSQIAYLSTAFTLEPGDLLATGTPHGVGNAMTPPLFLHEGDVVRCEIDEIGAIENKVTAAR